MNVFKYTREAKEHLKDWVRKKDFEADFKQKKERQELEEERAMLKRRMEHKKVKKEVREMRHPVLTKLAKNVSENIKRKHKQNKKRFGSDTKGGFKL